MFFNPRKMTLLLLILMLAQASMALEVDQTLTLRFLKVSSTKKTILVNRGIEDGLVMGDHAHFYVPEGVIARGVIIKIAPTRSVWSIYRTVNADYLKDDEVLNLKITHPVKISEDPSRQVWTSDKTMRVAPAAPANIPLAEGADDFNDELANSSDPELEELVGKKEEISASKLELFGGVNFSNQSVTATSSSASTGTVSGSNQHILLMLGGEFYYLKTTSWLSNFSLAPFFQMDTNRVFGRRGSQVGNNFIDFGFMVNYHPFSAKPWHIGKFIPYLNFTYAYRSGSDTFDPGVDVTTTVGGVAGQPESFSGSGSGSAMAFGLGVKMNVNKHWGMRVLASYESSSITYEADTTGTSWSRSASGLKLMTAIGYRF